MNFELKRIEVWPLFRNSFFVSSILFILFFMVMGNAIMEMQAMLSQSMGSGDAGVATGPFMLIIGAILNALLFSGFLAAGASLYNVVSSRFGGYRFHLDGEFEVETLIEEIETHSGNEADIAQAKGNDN